MRIAERHGRGPFRPSRVESARALALLIGLSFFGGILEGATTVSYVLDLTHPASHLVGVTLSVPEARSGTEIQFPAWNALYQIRDFVRHVQDLQAECSGQPIRLAPVNLYTWRTGPRSCAPLVIRYQVYANRPGVFWSELIDGHAFLNLAQILFYLPDQRNQPDRVRFRLPPEWRLVSFLPQDPATGEYRASNYDALADSPVEAGEFQLYSFRQGGATYRVVVRGNTADYSASQLISSIEKITASETALMRDVPFARYAFIFHFSNADGGGMEHSYGAAISFPAAQLKTNWEELEASVAHEFFHVWNVKRIRPKGLEPVDYIHGNDTRDLWFSEGVTNTYMELTLLRAGLIDRKKFYERVAQDIQRLQQRPARHFQSAELSGLEAWLEKYPDYSRPQRSISYYNKGELLGYLLDLGIRHASGNRYSLDDLMLRLNADFARRYRYFTDADLERIVNSLAPPSSWVESFFQNCVTGTRELDYQEFLGYAGLRLAMVPAPQPDWGFQAIQNFDGLIQVISVNPGSSAAQAGLESGDILTRINNQALYALPRNITGLKPGQRVKLRVGRGSKMLTLKFNLGSKPEAQYRVEEIPNPTSQQLAVRNGWLEGKTSGSENLMQP